MVDASEGIALNNGLNPNQTNFPFPFSFTAKKLEEGNSFTMFAPKNPKYLGFISVLSKVFHDLSTVYKEELWFKK